MTILGKSPPLGLWRINLFNVKTFLRGYFEASGSRFWGSDGHDFDIRVDLFLDHVFDRHKRPGQRTWAAATCSLIANTQRVVDELDDLEPAAVAGEVRPDAFIEKLVDTADLRVVGCRSGNGTADSGG